MTITTASLDVFGLYSISWNRASLPKPLAFSQVIVLPQNSGDTLYVIGGNLSGSPMSLVSYTTLSADGTPQEWISTTALPTSTYYHAAVALRGRIYVLGGRIDPSTLSSTVYCGHPDISGAISQWIPSPLNRQVGHHAAVAIDDHIYLIGGYQKPISQNANIITGNTEAVQSAIVGDDCHSPLEWAYEPSLTISVSNHTAVATVVNGRKFIYVAGGYVSQTQSLTSIVQRTEVTQTGALGQWVNLGPITGMSGTQLLASAVSGKHLYVFGGSQDLRAQTSISTIFRAEIISNGNLGLWTSSTLPTSLHGHAAGVSDLGRIYIIGGKSHTAYQNSLYFTPLALFSKSADPPGEVLPGDSITYTIHFANNGLRSIDNLIISDTIPTNTQLIWPERPSDTTVISWATTLPITGAGSVSFTVKVHSRPGDGSRLNATPTPIPKTISLEDTDEPCDEDDEDDEDDAPISEPEPTCTPSLTPTDAPTPSLTPTPISVINFAWLCEDGLWCIKSNTVINSPFRAYLPIILK